MGLRTQDVRESSEGLTPDRGRSTSSEVRQEADSPSSAELREDDTITPRVALDMENVLADSHGHFLTHYNIIHGTDYEKSDIDSWDWVEREVDFDEFMSIVQQGWRHRHESIMPCEGGLSMQIDYLSDFADIDIVTARTGVEREMKEWLDAMGIEYDNFHSIDPSETKATLTDRDVTGADQSIGRRYDYFIDDKPHLADKLVSTQRQYVVSCPWNRGEWDDRRGLAVTSVRDAVTSIANKVRTKRAVRRFSE